MFCYLRFRRPPVYTRTYTLFPYTPLFRSPAVELRMQTRLKAVRAFARRHSIDRLACAAPRARVGLVTVGKAHLDTLEALARLGRSEEHTSELQSLMRISYAVLCLKTKKTHSMPYHHRNLQKPIPTTH